MLRIIGRMQLVSALSRKIGASLTLLRLSSIMRKSEFSTELYVCKIACCTHTGGAQCALLLGLSTLVDRWCYPVATMRVPFVANPEVAASSEPQMVPYAG